MIEENSERRGGGEERKKTITKDHGRSGAKGGRENVTNSCRKSLLQ